MSDKIEKEENREQAVKKPLAEDLSKEVSGGNAASCKDVRKIRCKEPKASVLAECMGPRRVH